jgi:CBS-domain-containing membrane protein
MRTWQVNDVMSTEIVTVGPDTPYREIVDTLITHGFSSVPVTDDARNVLGVVSEADLLHKVERLGAPDQRRIFEGRRRRAGRAKAEGMTAAELMTAPAVTVTPDVPLAAAAARMDRMQVKRLPVVDDLGRLVGLVTRGDLLRVHLRSDEDIRRDIVEEVFRRILAVPDDTVEITVRDGVVRLTGQLDRRTSAELAGRLAAQVSGVVSVENELGFDYDDVMVAAIGGWPV